MTMLKNYFKIFILPIDNSIYNIYTIDIIKTNKTKGDLKQWVVQQLETM